MQRGGSVEDKAATKIQAGIRGRAVRREQNEQTKLKNIAKYFIDKRMLTISRTDFEIDKDPILPYDGEGPRNSS